MKVVINNCFGGFGLSHEAVMLYAEKKGLKLYPDYKHENLFISYRLVTLEDYEEVYKEDEKKRNYRKSNELCFSSRDIERNNPLLIEVVEELKENANTKFSKLKIIEIPDDVEFEIDEYDGLESIHEKHRSWS